MDEQVYLPMLKFSTMPPGIANVRSPVSLYRAGGFIDCPEAAASTQEIVVVPEYSISKPPPASTSSCSRISGSVLFSNSAHAFLCKLLHSRSMIKVHGQNARPCTCRSASFKCPRSRSCRCLMNTVGMTMQSEIVKSANSIRETQPGK